MSLKSIGSVIQTGLKFIAVGVAFLLTVYSMAHFIFFLSNPNYNVQNEVQQNEENGRMVIEKLFIDTLLLTLFVLQHSLMAHPNYKNLLLKWGIDDLQRCIYVICTMISLQTLMYFWKPILSVSLWNYTFTNGPLWWTYIVMHSLSWILIYIGSISMDIGELLGYKQVYYNAKQLGDPLSFKTVQLQKLYKHMRHPGFLVLNIIFWVIPVMTLDRLLLSTMFSLYMYISFRTDLNDYEYQRKQYIKKFIHLR